MKKFVSVLSITMTIVLAICLLTACKPTNQAEESDNISYMQQSFYSGANMDFSARLIGGTSETLFVADGQTNDVKPFVTLTLIPQHVDLFNESYTYTLSGDKGEISGAMNKDSFGASYTAEIEDLSKVGTPIALKITYDSKESNLELTDMLANTISGVRAMEIATANLQEKLTASAKPREIYVKYINDAESDHSAYYWYVAFIASPTDYYAVLINAEGQIVSINP